MAFIKKFSNTFAVRIIPCFYDYTTIEMHKIDCDYRPNRDCQAIVNYQTITTLQSTTPIYQFKTSFIEMK